MVLKTIMVASIITHKRITTIQQLLCVADPPGLGVARQIAATVDSVYSHVLLKVYNRFPEDLLDNIPMITLSCPNDPPTPLLASCCLPCPS